MADKSLKKKLLHQGGFYISKWSALLEQKTFYTPKTLSFEVDEVSALEIDEPLDWEFAEFIVLNKLNEINNK